MSGVAAAHHPHPSILLGATDALLVVAVLRLVVEDVPAVLAAVPVLLVRLLTLR